MSNTKGASWSFLIITQHNNYRCMHIYKYIYVYAVIKPPTIQHFFPTKSATFYNKCVHARTYFVSQFISLISHLGGRQFLCGQRMTNSAASILVSHGS